MKVLLVKTSSISDHIQPPLGLAYLAAAIRPDHQVEILDMLKDRMTDQVFQARLTAGHYDLVGFQCYTQELQAVSRLSRLVKAASPKTITLAGGPHPTLLPHETMASLGQAMDYLLCGEADETFPRFMEMLLGKLPPDGVPGLVWKDQGQARLNPGAGQVQDLDRLRLPAWDLIRPETYPPAQHGAFFKRFPIAPIITTRGCPYACKFCSAPLLSGQRVRHRSQDAIIQEMRLLYEQHGIREFHIIDDNFTINQNHARAVLARIIDQAWGISLAFPNGIRIETVDESLLALMKKSGVYLISLGLESGSNRMLAAMNKKLTVEKIRKKISLIHAAGMAMAGFFVIGFPDETEAEVLQTIDFSLSLPLLRANYFDFLPLPGTPVYRELEQRGELEKIDWGQFHFMTAPYAPRGLTRARLRKLQRLAFLKFYLRPGILWKNLRQIKSFRHFKYLLRRFYHWVIM